MIRFLILLIIAAISAYAFTHVDTAALKKEITGHLSKEALNTFTLSGVTIREFDESGAHVATVSGTKATVSKDFKSTVIDDIQVIDHSLVPSGILTAREGIRKTDRKLEQLLFNGNVVLVQGPETTLLTEKLYYYPRESIVETPVHSTLRTTDTTICGDVLQTSLKTEKGTVRGNVVVERDVIIENSESKHVVITGHYSSFDLTSNFFTVKGNVTVSEKEMKLTCSYLEYDMKKDICLATGSVAATDPEVILMCSRLEYNVGKDLVRVSASPSSQSTPSASRTSFRIPGDMSTWQLTELHGRKIVYERMKGVLKAEKEVRVVRWGLNDQELIRDFIISSDTLNSEFRNSPGQASDSKLRSNFDGNVQIVSDQVGATGNKAVFYEHTRNFYVIGNATAWEYTPTGEKTNFVSGGKIFHDNKRQRNIVIGGVSGIFSGGDD